MDRAGAKVIGVDIPLQEPSPPGRGGATSDAMLFEATARSQKVVFSLPVVRVKPAGHPLPSSAGHVSDASYPFWQTSRLPSSSTMQSVQFTHNMLPSVAKEALDIGHALVVHDPDGVVRRVPLLMMLQSRVLPSFSMALYVRYLSASPDRLVVMPGDSLQFSEAAIPGRQTGDLHIPVDANGNTLVTVFPNDRQKGTEWLSIEEVQQWVEKDDLERLRSKVSGKLVVMSFSDQKQAWPTSIHQAIPQEMLQASVLVNLFQEQWVREVPPLPQYFMTVLLSCVAAWMFFGTPGWKGPVVGGASSWRLCSIGHGTSGVGTCGSSAWDPVAGRLAGVWSCCLMGTGVLRESDS